MAFWQARDFLFCGVCGTLLTFDSLHYASCPLCGFKRKTKEIQGKETRYAVTGEDIRRDLKLDPFVVLESTLKDETAVKRATINRLCPECGYHELEYYTKQLRSADEGQTVFFECRDCRHKFNENQ
ncbi:DNA-directed RNA polymerase I subunit RPA12-like [Oryza brachyantha]|uniref:DNA-directed RNA polymerase subunit n=1 Tax=Oryza brachyantha TaxID=4533 RepID=J3LS48_ORYBR|nr:DNA-directed RNA polymerase I subunit RPA12-like [Oryza brachyantha]